MGVGTLGENECNERGVRSRSPPHWVGRDAQQLGRAKFNPNKIGREPRAAGRALGGSWGRDGRNSSRPAENRHRLLVQPPRPGLQTKAKMKGFGEQWVSLARQRAPRWSVRALLRTKHRPTDAGHKLGGLGSWRLGSGIRVSIRVIPRTKGLNAAVADLERAVGTQALVL